MPRFVGIQVIDQRLRFFGKAQAVLTDIALKSHLPHGINVIAVG